MFPIEPLVLVHGGAGDIPSERVPGKLLGVKLAAKVGYEKLRQTGCVLDAVEEAVRSMELDPFFNAGYGSVLTTEGNVEMEASVMCGTTQRAGCVSLIKDIMHPISLARRVMKTPHNFLAGDGAMRFAKDEGFEIMEPAGQLVTDYAREALEEWKESQRRGENEFARTEIGSSNKYKVEVGTVGAVAIDGSGNIAVATSTGGITGKLPGRIGDTPLVGCGTYADNRVGGVSTTGHGETIMRHCLAYDILKRMEYLQEDAQTATENSCKRMTERLIGTAGAITIDAKGQVGISFNSKRMAWAYQKCNTIVYGIEQGQIIEEVLTQ
ncbi:probable isoaspartyl peptidase/L-asparaginase GA20639 [Toxorhynchites rutilus septentrionalis]|uniref:probable isoaspartyl peptidase/L-asparaginase GA20639 n=1 Tax=Toxorhynchites rutilus septentrionalis TaxID=329112 RepID=UPI00247A98D3|nr:probable isoaspartyl peptidase/L-asparaginase GA20639 [Toxorhynchites rutilus septentrionalis]